MDRYSRQVLFPPVGEAGQEAIGRATVAIVGCGGLGSLHVEALARAGVGCLRLIDRDTVDFTNLQRQWLYTEADAREELPKAIAAARRVAEVNRGVRAEAHPADLTADNAEELLAGCDVVLDGTDNFEARYLLNDVSVKLGAPWIYGAAVGSRGVTAAFDTRRGPCFRCLYPERPSDAYPTCDVDGVLAAATGAIASLQVAGAIRFLVGWPDFSCRLWSLDVWEGSSRIISAGRRDEECPCCVERRFDWLEGERRTPVSLCGRNAVQLHARGRQIDLASLGRRVRARGEVRVNDFALYLRMPPYDVTVFPDGRAIVKGTTDVATARGVYAQLLGS